MLLQLLNQVSTPPSLTFSAYTLLYPMKATSDQRNGRGAGLRELHAAALPLYRASAFKQDLTFYLGPDWEADIRKHSLSPQVQAYLDHLDNLAQTEPLLLAAHAFTQLLAVASGGQILARLVKKGLGLGEGQAGVAAYSYDGVKRPKVLKDAFKQRIDKLGEQIPEDAAAKVSVNECCMPPLLPICRALINVLTDKNP